jgi:hypothetical protein
MLTIGNTVLADDARITPRELRHEAGHSTQFAILGPNLFPGLYVGGDFLPGENPFECSVPSNPRYDC